MVIGGKQSSYAKGMFNSIGGNRIGKFILAKARGTFDGSEDQGLALGGNRDIWLANQVGG